MTARTQITHCERQAVRRSNFNSRAGGCDVDGEVLTLECQAIDVLPSALRVVV